MDTQQLAVQQKIFVRGSILFVIVVVLVAGVCCLPPFQIWYHKLELHRLQELLYRPFSVSEDDAIVH